MPETPSTPGKPLQQALSQAGNTASEKRAAEDVELFRIKVGPTPFAIESGMIHEVIRIPPITPLPMAPQFLVGVAALRGDVVAVVDVARLLGRGETQVGTRTRLAIAKCEGMTVALLADEVLGVARYPAATLQPAPLGTETGEFVSGIVLEAQPLDILDLRRALSTARERVASAKR